MGSRRSHHLAPLAAATLFAASAGLAGAQQGGAAGAASDTTRRQWAGVNADSTRRDSAITPVADQARGMDAEIRVAMFELMHDRDIPALSRLRALQAAPMSLGDSARARGALRGREDLLFLLSQSYYRLGLDSAFRTAAQPLASTGRYAPVLKGQLLLESYRRGDYARARQLAGEMQGGEQRGLAQLVTGLANYQGGDFAAARASFQQAQSSGEPYARYARYMDALTQLRADTSNVAAALQGLEAAAQGASGEFADQVRLTAAQVAYEAERWDDAVRLAQQVSPQGGLASQALLTEAWARYKKDDVEGAGTAFARFADTYPQLPERDEARLMAAQAMLQQNRTADAGRLFQLVADSLNAEATALQGRTPQTMSDAARALVQARAAGLLFVEHAATGKTVALQEGAGAEGNVLAAVMSDSVRVTPAVGAPEMVSYDDLAARLKAAGNAEQMVSRRILFAPASATTARTDYAVRASALYDADVAVAVARYELAEQMDAQQRQLATLRALQAFVTSEAQSFDALEKQLSAARDSLARLATALDAAAVSLQQLLTAQVNTTRMLANENVAALDSLRRGLSGGLRPEDQTLLEAEARTAALYQETARIIEQGLQGAVQRHPTFALRDSVRARGDLMGQQLAEARSFVNQTQSAITAEIARLESGDMEKVARARQTLASAETRRTGAEQLVVAVVERELGARAGELLAGLRRDVEAAEFGTASSSFFQALDADRGTTGAGAGATGGSASRTRRAETPVATTTLPQKK